VIEFYFHPLSSFCHKVLIALYENGTQFTPVPVDLGDPASRASFEAIWPVAKMPVLRAGTEVIPESTIIIEWLREHRPGPIDLLPSAMGWQTRLADRFYDHYVEVPMQKIVADRLRPADRRDAFGVVEARAALEKAYAFVETQMATRTWATGETFTMADCAAAPALYWANRVAPIATPHARAYLDRLLARPSFARVLSEAEPYQKFFPAD